MSDMAKLNAKERKSLPDSLYGLPEDRKYPMPDESHVRSAIRFFSSCPDGKKKELAKNINRRAKELNMKLLCDGPFMRYISPDVKATKEDHVCIITDASNIGTLSPIVGGIDQSTVLRFDPTSGENQKAKQKMLEVLKGKYDLGFSDDDNLETMTESFGYIRSDIPVDGLDPKYSISHTISANVLHEISVNTLDEYIRDVIREKELNDVKAYMTSSAPKGQQYGIFTYNIKMMQCNLATCIQKIIADASKDQKEKVHEIVHMLFAVKDKHDLIAHLAMIYRQDGELFLSILKNIDKFWRDKPINRLTGLSFGFSYPNGVHYHLDRIQKEKMIQGFPEKLIPPLTNYIHRWTCQYDLYYIDGVYHNKMVPYMISPYEMQVYLSSLYRRNRIDGYWCSKEYDVSFIIMGNSILRVLIANGENDKYLIGVLYAYIERGEIGNDLHLDTSPSEKRDEYFNENSSDLSKFASHILAWKLCCKDHYHNYYDFATEGIHFKPYLHKVTNFLRGIHLGSNGDIRFTLQDQLTFDHYEQTHKILKEAAREKRYEAMKSNLAYIFTLIATIESLYTSKEANYSKSDPKYLEMVRLRALYMSDFKQYLRIVMQHEKNFDFMKYYENSKENKNVYTIKADDIKNAAKLFRMIMIG